MPRISTISSVVLHLAVLGLALVSSTLAPDLVPSPRRVLAFERADMIQIGEVPLPRASRTAGRATSTNESIAAPLQMPDRIGEDIGVERPTGAADAPIDRIGMENGVPDGLPGVSAVPSPPPPPARQEPMRLRSGMQPPQKIVNVQPRYPAMAQTARIEGTVILEAVIDARGAVASVKVLRSVSLLDEAAVDAVRQWTFTPTLLNGEAVPIVMTVTVTFTLK